VRGARGEIHFAAGGDLVDLRGEAWSVEGDRGLLDLEVRDGLVQSATYPDALARVWSALRCPGGGELLLSAGPRYEFVDWGGADHVGGGAHGALHVNDSLGALILCGTGPEDPRDRAQWAIRDVAGVVLDHFGAAPASGARLG
jgi:hypothetical protein